MEIKGNRGRSTVCRGYGYDNLGRLEQENAHYSGGYAYDAVGNRVNRLGIPAKAWSTLPIAIGL